MSLSVLPRVKVCACNVHHQCICLIEILQTGPKHEILSFVGQLKGQSSKVWLCQRQLLDTYWKYSPRDNISSSISLPLREANMPSKKLYLQGTAGELQLHCPNIMGERKERNVLSFLPFVFLQSPPSNPPFFVLVSHLLCSLLLFWGGEEMATHSLWPCFRSSRPWWTRSLKIFGENLDLHGIYLLKDVKHTLVSMNLLTTISTDVPRS